MKTLVDWEEIHAKTFLERIFSSYPPSIVLETILSLQNISDMLANSITCTGLWQCKSVTTLRERIETHSMARNNHRKHRGICNSQSFDSVYPQVRVDNTVICFRCHATSTGWMIQRLDPLPDNVFEFLVSSTVMVGVQEFVFVFEINMVSEGSLFNNLENETQTTTYLLDVFRRWEIPTRED